MDILLHPSSVLCTPFFSTKYFWKLILMSKEGEVEAAFTLSHSSGFLILGLQFLGFY